MRPNNLFFAFLGGAAVGALATYAYLKHRHPEISPVRIDDEQPLSESSDGPLHLAGKPMRDKPSFEQPKTIDTHKVQYDGIVNKPSLEELTRRYNEPKLERDLAAREHPEDDTEDLTDDELEDEAEALMDHPGQMEIEETDGFGHVICELNTGRKNSAVYLVPEEYAGEIYPIESLSYFSKDDVLVDVTDAPVDDPQGLIGDATKHFGECGEDPDVVYVRNANIGFEYEITRQDRYYAAYLYNVPDEAMEEDPE